MFRPVRSGTDERSRRLPGDELLPQTIGSFTHGITIRRPPHEVWPWLVQMGAGRAGWYSYDFIDNGGQPSANCIVPELQHVEVRDLVPALRGVTEGFTVLRVEHERSRVFGWLRPHKRQPLITWAYILSEPELDVTRLIVRARSGGGCHTPFGLPDWTIRTYTAWGHSLMQQKQLLGIAQRAESGEMLEHRG
jgi:hypothetical protein